jgi:protein phosphatase
MKFQWKKNTNKTLPESPDNSAASTSYACKVYTLSETGPTRNLNEDSIFYSYPDGHFQTFFGMVADGMGGHQAGEVASHIACEAASDYMKNHADETNITSLLRGCILAAQSAIIEAAEQNSSYKGMGTTATMIFIRERNLYFAHIGDSRLYHFKNSKLEQCTSDNTLVNEMVKEGKITAEEALNHDMKHVLTQALGTVKEIHPELAATGLAIEPGEIFFLCSDGIYDVLLPDEIERLLNMGSPGLAMDCIKALCTQRKASDNFSAILVEITSEKHLRAPVTKELNIML